MIQERGVQTRAGRSVIPLGGDIGFQPDRTAVCLSCAAPPKDLAAFIWIILPKKVKQKVPKNGRVNPELTLSVWRNSVV